jgi:hypothetical protein
MRDEERNEKVVQKTAKKRTRAPHTRHGADGGTQSGDVERLDPQVRRRHVGDALNM